MTHEAEPPLSIRDPETPRRSSRSRPHARPPHRWRTVALFALLIGISASGAAIGSTFAANFSAKTAYDTSQFQTASLTAPTGLTATPKGKNVTLAWTHASTSVKNKQVVAIYDQKTKTACSSSTPSSYTAFTNVTSSLSTTANSYTDSSRSTSGTYKAGDWACYRVSSAYNTSWTASAYAHTQLGFVATSVVLKYTTQASTTTITVTTTITITFNQPLKTKPATTVKTGPMTKSVALCTFGKTAAWGSSANTVFIGDTTALGGPGKTCKTTDTVNVGKLKSSVNLTQPTPGGPGAGSTPPYPKITYAFSNTTKTITITIKTAPTGPGHNKTKILAATAHWTFTPATTLIAKTTTVHVCTSNAHTSKLCQPQATKNFK